MTKSKKHLNHSSSGGGVTKRFSGIGGAGSSNSRTGFGVGGSGGAAEKAGGKNTSAASDKDKKNTELYDNDNNSGFGDYIRSTEGVGMMKLFVMANTLMLIVTMAWPNLKRIYAIFLEYLYEEED